MKRSGVRRLLTGHAPHGESPRVNRGKNFLHLACDTSYSDMSAPKDRNPVDNRGQAVSVVKLTEDTVTVKGVLSNGAKHGFTLHTNPADDTFPDALVGRQMTD